MTAIVDHRLTYATWVPDEQGKPITPELIVLHYTVSRSLPGVVATFRARDYLSCHLTIDVDGSVTQMVAFDRLACHAGVSSWRGRKSCNGFSVGIELINPGPLLRQGEDQYVDVYGRPWTGEVVHGRHKHPACKYQHWAAYSDEQVDSTIRVCAELMGAYPSIVDVVGHEDIAPGRKTDPSPAFPWAPLRAALRLPDLDFK